MRSVSVQGVTKCSNDAGPGSEMEGGAGMVIEAWIPKSFCGPWRPDPTWEGSDPWLGGGSRL